ncbi:MAG: thiamine phosphate synthase [Rikenellaceae bacterium]
MEVSLAVEFNGIIVITPEKSYFGEHKVIEHITNSGSLLHIRKPKMDRSELSLYLEGISQSTKRENISIHYNLPLALKFALGGCHIRYNELLDALTTLKTTNTNQNLRFSCSLHSFKEAKEVEKEDFDYYFLSPIFDSISKKGYKSGFETSELLQFLEKSRKAVALGGISLQNLGYLSDFYSIALIGAVWSIKDDKLDVEQTIKNFDKILEKWERLKNFNI